MRYNIEETGFVTEDKIMNNKKIQHKVHAQPYKILEFQKKLSAMGNIFVNDAFGTSHRAHSSITGIRHKFKVAGLLMQK